MSAELDAAVDAIAARTELRPAGGRHARERPRRLRRRGRGSRRDPVRRAPGMARRNGDRTCGDARAGDVRRRSGRGDEGPCPPLRRAFAPEGRLRRAGARPPRVAQPRPHERLRCARPGRRPGQPRRDLGPPEPPGRVAARRSERRFARPAVPRHVGRLRPGVPRARRVQRPSVSASRSARGSTRPGSGPPSRRRRRSG